MISLARARRLRGAAAESKAKKELQELRLLRGIAENGLEFSGLDAQSAADLAKACHEALAAAQRLAVARVKEAEERLSVLKEAAELAKARMEEAEAQVGDVLVQLDHDKFNVAPPPDLIPEYTEPTVSEMSFQDDDPDDRHQYLSSVDVDWSYGDSDYEDIDIDNECEEDFEEEGDEEIDLDPNLLIDSSV